MEDGEFAAARNWLLGLSFSGEQDLAVFTNVWIKLKDWANYNWHEWKNRYFSSRNELEHEFAKAGFATSEAEGATVEPFEMVLHAPRFQEDAINRLAYLAMDPLITERELNEVFSQNPRYQLFWEFSRHHLPRWEPDAVWHRRRS